MSVTSIDELSQSVQKAVAEIKKLRRENARLEEKAVMLEKRLEASSEVSPDDAAWLEERDLIRGRVAELVEHLEGAMNESR